jgi:hypothetical protein
MTAAADTSTRSGSLADIGLGGLILVLAAFTVAVVAGGAVAPAVVNDRLDIAIVTVSTMTAAAVASLARSRGRVTHEPDAHLRASAFTVLATLNLILLLSALAGAEATIGAAIDDLRRCRSSSARSPARSPRACSSLPAGRRWRAACPRSGRTWCSSRRPSSWSPSLPWA